MSVESTITKVIYQGNGVTTEWPVPFAYNQSEHLHVLVADADGKETAITENFTVVSGGGATSIIYPASGPALASGNKLVVYRSTPQTQIVDLEYGGAFRPETLEKDGLDRLVMMVQEQQEEADRSVKVPRSSAQTPEDLIRGLYDSRDMAVEARSGAETARDAATVSLAEAGEKAAQAGAAAERAEEAAERAESITGIGPATEDVLGLVKIGAGIGVGSDGKISVTPMNPGDGLDYEEESGRISLGNHAAEDGNRYGLGNFQNFGHVRLTDNPDEEAGAKDGTAASPRALQAALDRILQTKEDVTVTTSGTYAVPFTGAYSITAVGGGGNGGNDSGNPFGGRGGGGGAGQVSTISRQLTKGQEIPIVIGGSGGGQTSVGDFLTAAGGGNGGDGQPGNYNPWHGTGNMGAPGAAGFSYGTPASPGGNMGTAATGGTSAFPPYGNGGNGGTLISAPSNVLPPTPGTSGCVRITLTKLGG